MYPPTLPPLVPLPYLLPQEVRTDQSHLSSSANLSCQGDSYSNVVLAATNQINRYNIYNLIQDRG